MAKSPSASYGSRMLPHQLMAENAPRGFLSPRGQTEEQLAMEMEQQRLQAEAQARADAQLAAINEQQMAAKYLAQQQSASTQGQQQLAGQSNQAQMQRLVQGQRGDMAMQNAQLGGQSAMADAANRARAAESARKYAQEREMSATDFAHQDKLAQLASQLRMSEYTGKSALDAKQQETEYLRNRSDQFNNTLSQFGQTAKRLTPEGQAKYGQMKNQLDVLEKARKEGQLDDGTYLRERSRLQDEFMQSGLGSEVVPYGQMPGDIVDRGIMQYQMGPEGYSPLGVRPNITSQDIAQYGHNLPPGTGFILDPTTGKPTVVQQRQAAGGAAGATGATGQLAEKDYLSAVNERWKTMAQVAENLGRPQPTWDDARNAVAADLAQRGGTLPQTQPAGAMPQSSPATPSPSGGASALPAPSGTVPLGWNTKGLPGAGLPTAQSQAQATAAQQIPPQMRNFVQTQQAAQRPVQTQTQPRTATPAEQAMQTLMGSGQQSSGVPQLSTDQSARLQQNGLTPETWKQALGVAMTMQQKYGNTPIDKIPPNEQQSLLQAKRILDIAAGRQ